MLSRPPCQGTGRRRHTGARASGLLLLLAASLAAASKDLTPGPSPAGRGEPVPGTAAVSSRLAGGTPAFPGIANTETALQRLAEEAEQIDPAAPDAVARLRAVVRGLIELERAHQQEIAALRAELSTARVASTSRSSAPTATKPAASPPTGRMAASNGNSSGPQTAAAGGLFGKRGLNKVHRPGCPSGERISAETRLHFKTLAEAKAAGYEPCKSCRPTEP